MALIKAAMADAILTSMWVFSVSVRALSTSIIASYLDIEPKSLLCRILISVNVSSVFVLSFIFISAAMGGASFNPTTTVSSYVARRRSDASFLSLAVRLPAQAAGGVGGVKAILKMMPKQYRHVFMGPSLKVDLHTGALVEGILGFLFSFSLHFFMVKSPKNLILKVWLVGLVTVTLVVAGGKYTGPSLNPANAYGWANANNWHNTWEFFYVYWVGPIIGGVFAGLLYRLLLFNAPTKLKQKKA